MSMYNTKELSELLDVNEETVRRWIRSGKLKAERSSKKTRQYCTRKRFIRFCIR